MVDIRSLKEPDSEAWLDARQELWPTSTRVELENDLKAQLRSDNFIAWSAWEEKSIVGFLELFVRPFANGCRSQPVPFLEAIWVASAWRGKGLSRKLLESAEKWAIAQGYNEIGSDADLENINSHGAHEAWGFTETERVVYFRKDLGDA